MSIDKNKVKKKVKELRKVANNPILNEIGNSKYVHAYSKRTTNNIGCNKRANL